MNGLSRVAPNPPCNTRWLQFLNKEVEYGKMSNFSPGNHSPRIYTCSNPGIGARDLALGNLEISTWKYGFL
jgi:hypothetical protein